MPPNLKGFKLRWTQTIKRDEEKGSISIYTPWYFKKEMGYGILSVIIVAVMLYLIQGHPWLSMTAFPGVIGATFTGKASGVWDTEGQTTWNEAGHPVAGDTVTTGAFAITCGSATACATLTVSAGGSLNTTASNWSLTTTNACTVSGTLTLNGSTVSCTGTGAAGPYSLRVNSGGTWTGGSATITIGDAYFAGGSSITMSSGTTSFNAAGGSGAGLTLAMDSTTTFAHGNGTVAFIKAGAQLLYDTSNTARTFYNVTVNNASCALSYYTGKSFALTVANNLTITAGSFTTWDGTTSADLTVTNLTSVTGTLDCKASTCSFGSALNNIGSYALAIRAGGTFTGGSGAHTAGSIGVYSTSTATLTSNTTTVNGTGVPTESFVVNSGATAFAHGSGTLTITCTQNQQVLCVAKGTLYNLIINTAAPNVLLSAALTCSNNLTITAGTLNTSDGTARSLTVTAATSITGTLTTNTSTCTFNGAVTVNNGGTLGGNTAWVCDNNLAITVSSGGTFSAPNAAGTFTSKNFTVNTGGVFNADSGTVNFDITEAYLQGTLNPIVFVNITISGGTCYLAPSGLTVQGALTINASRYAFMYTLTYTLGTVSASGTIVNNGNLYPSAASQSVTIQAASSTYPVVCTGTDWNWDLSATSTWNLKWLDYQIDATTGGGGCTVNFTGNMTIDGWAVSAGDTLSCTVAGTTITGNVVKLFTCDGTLTLTGAAGNNIVIGSGTRVERLYLESGTANLQYVTVNGYNYGIHYVAGTIALDNLTVTATNIGAGGGAGLVVTGTAICTVTNSTLTGVSGSWSREDVSVYTGAKVQLSSCTFTTVGMQATSGWLVSKDHAGVTNDYRFYGVANVNTPSAGYRPGQNDNITVKNADAYSTPFNSILTMNVDLNCQYIVTNASTSIAISTGIQVIANCDFVNNGAIVMTGPSALVARSITGSGTVTINSNSIIQANGAGPIALPLANPIVGNLAYCSINPTVV